MKFVFVTPSYRGDFDRCRLLCESTTRFLPEEVEHLLIVSRRDMKMFKALESEVVRLIEAEALLPWWILRAPVLSGWRLNLTGIPVRGWIHQQLLKMSVVDATDADVINFIDSDVTLIRPVDLGFFVRDGLVRLQHTSYENPVHKRWLEVARKLLNIPRCQVLSGNYIGNFITWKRDNIIKMRKYIEKNSGLSWQMVLAGKKSFSEYMIYGAYVQHCLGMNEAGCFLDDRPNLFLCWGYDFKSKVDRTRFFEEVPSDSFGIMIDSKYGISVDEYREQVQTLWRR